MEGVGLRVKNEGCRIKSGEFKGGGGVAKFLVPRTPPPFRQFTPKYIIVLGEGGINNILNSYSFGY